MTADIRTAAQREAEGLRYWRHRWSPTHVTTVDMAGTINASQWEPVHVLTDSELAARVTPTQEQVAKAIAGASWHHLSDMDRGTILEQAEAVLALDGAPEQYEHESVAPQPSESDVRERLVEAALETVDWDAIDAGEASPREAAGHAVWKALAALDGAPEPEWEYGCADELNGFLYDMPSLESAEANCLIDTIVTRPSGEELRYKRHIVRRQKAGPWLPVEGESKP